VHVCQQYGELQRPVVAANRVSSFIPLLLDSCEPAPDRVAGTCAKAHPLKSASNGAREAALFPFSMQLQQMHCILS
jgi:hypothetical protein